MPEHTPNKQSKIDISITDNLRSSSHEMSVSSYTLDPNEENYSVNLEKYCNPSPFPDSGFDSSSSVLAAQTPLSTYKSSKDVFSFDTQQHGSSACSLQNPLTNKTLCPEKFSQTNVTYDKGTTAFQEICSSSNHNGTWNVLPSSVNSFWNSKQGGVQDQKSDISFDTGYSSHSTGSSNPCQDSQVERSYMEQGSQLGFETDDNGSQAGNDFGKDNYLCGESELEDLLYHFQNFFQNRFESEFQRYREAMYGILQEQQSHVRQIVHTAITEQSSSQRNLTEEFLTEETEKAPAVIKPAVQSDIGMTQNPVLEKEYYIPTRTSIQSDIPCSSTTVEKDGATRNKLLELYSLSCSVSTLLAKKQFKS